MEPLWNYISESGLWFGDRPTDHLSSCFTYNVTPFSATVLFPLPNEAQGSWKLGIHFFRRTVQIIVILRGSQCEPYMCTGISALTQMKLCTCFGISTPLNNNSLEFTNLYKHKICFVASMFLFNCKLVVYLFYDCST